MAVNAPVVEFLDTEFQSDGSETTNLRTISEWDAGIVDAGTQSKKKILYVFNNRGDSNDRSDMQNVTIGVVSNEDGNQGAETDAVWENQWCCLVPHQLSDGTPLEAKEEVPTADEIADATPLGKDPSDGHSNTFKATAVGLDPQDSAQQYRILGEANDGTVAGARNNYVKFATYIDLGANAAAGTHKFRLRVTYSYT